MHQPARRRPLHHVLIPIGCSLYVAIAMFRWATWRHEVFPIAAWSMFQQHRPVVVDFAVEVHTPGGIERPALDGRARVLAASLYGEHSREPDSRRSEAERKALESILFDDSASRDERASYYLLRLNVDRRTRERRVVVKERLGPWIDGEPGPELDADQRERRHGPRVRQHRFKRRKF